MERRLYAHQVVEAFKKTDLKPMQRTFVEFSNGIPTCGCAITAYYMHREQDDQNFNPTKSVSLAKKEFGFYYTWGLVFGFDNRQIDEIPEGYQVKDFEQGFQDGQLARLALIDEGFHLKY